VVRNTALNLGGSLVPMLVSLVTIPPILQGCGVERFGIIAMSLTLMGYFTLFDFGLGRATTRFVAAASSAHDDRAVAGYFWSSFGLNVLLGLAGAAILSSLAPWLAGSALPLAASLRSETANAIVWLAVAVPLLTTASSFNGALEGYHRFDLVNLVQVPSDLALKVAPLLVLPVTGRVDAVIAVFVLIRLASACLGMVLCLRFIPGLRTSPSLQRERLTPLLSFGGWLTVTNVVGPIMTYLDRFLIGAFLSMSAVTYYIVPFDVLRRLQVLPHSLGRVLFPIFGTRARGDLHHDPIQRRYEQALKSLAVLMTPAVVGLMALGGDFLRVWLGDEFAERSTAIMQILVVGVYLNALSKPSYWLIQGTGRPDVTAKFHLLELAVYVPVLLVLMSQAGIAGVALAWTARVIVDASLLHAYARRILGSAGAFASGGAPGQAVALLLMGLAWGASRLDGFGLRLIATVVLLLIGLLWSWHRTLGREERSEIGSRAFHLLSRMTSWESRTH
jgi:O-antigen/teichoic acid export membrane protein